MPTLRQYIVKHYGDMRMFRQQKRAQARNARLILGTLRADGHALPVDAQSDIRDATILIDRVIKELSQKKWGK